MAHRSSLECVDELLKGITGHNSPFGGEIVLRISDFCQVAPVFRFARKTEIMDKSIVLCPLWYSLSLLRLYEPIRNASDPEYAQWVDTIGHRTVRIDEGDISLDKIADVDNIDDAITFLYPSETLPNPERCILNSFLSPLNLYVAIFNITLLNGLPNEQGLPHLHSSLFTLLTSFGDILQFRFDQSGTKKSANRPFCSYNGLSRS